MTTALPADYDVRAATSDEIPEIARTVIEYDLEVGGYSDFTEEDLREISRRRSIFDLENDTWVVREQADIAALALTWGSDSDVLSAIGIVKRSHVGVGLGSFLVDCTEDRARRLASGRPHRTIELHNSVDVKDTSGFELLEKRGYKSVRRHYTMHTMLDHAIEPVVPPAIRIRTCRLSDAPLLHRLLQETFADHWGHRPVSYEEWSDAFLSRKDTDPSLWFVAEVDEDPIGFLLGTSDGPRGWVEDLGVISAWRRRGVGGALLRRAFAEFRRRGLTEAGLEVDAGNETGAVRVYERAGLQAVRIYETLEKTIGAALD
jgi:mycothiol synthase